MSPVRAWVGVHQWRAAVALLMATAAASILTRSLHLDHLGALPLAFPIHTILILPVVAGVAVATACVGPQLPLPLPGRAKIARALWVSTWTLLAIGSVISAADPGAGAAILDPMSPWVPVATPAAIVRNVLLAAALALVAHLLDHPDLAWVAPLLITFISMLFGGTGNGGNLWWAVIIDHDASPNALIVAMVAYLIAASSYIFLSGRKRRI